MRAFMRQRLWRQPDNDPGTKTSGMRTAGGEGRRWRRSADCERPLEVTVSGHSGF